MKQHKWHKEIKAWADGERIEQKWINSSLWEDVIFPSWNSVEREYRIKPQPKEPQYLYVWNVFGEIVLTQDKNGVVIDTWDPKVPPKCIGKIKLEDSE